MKIAKRIVVWGTLATAATLLISCPANSLLTSVQEKVRQTNGIDAPTFSPFAGTYASAQQVTISSATPGAYISYTTNGSTPTASGAGSPVTVSVVGSETIEAIAYIPGGVSSAVSTAIYTITGTVAAPTFSPSAGTYTINQQVTISSATPGAYISYTTNGSTPTASGGAVGPVAVSVVASETVEAIAYLPGWTNSTVSTAIYTINYLIPGPGPGGGIVFYDKGSYSNGWRYLEVAPWPDQSTGASWDNGPLITTGASGTAIGTGASNTALIVADQGAGDYAAILCSSLSIGGYHDWFLPSKDELNQIYLIGTEYTGFTGNYYWSSSEVSNWQAWVQNPSGQAEVSKDGGCSVRAVREF